MPILRRTLAIANVLLAAIALALILPTPRSSNGDGQAASVPVSAARPTPTPSPRTEDDLKDAPPPAARQETPEPLVLRVANSFPDGGGFNWDSGTGTPEEIRFKGKRILSKARSGTYCCGFTFAVVMRAAQEAGLLQDKSVTQIRRFQQHWYAATPEARERQQIHAMEWLGIGREVPLMDSQPGDFIRLWHGGSGHSVILVRWVILDGRKVGIEYRGTQGSTGGIGNRTEYLSGAPGHVDGDFVIERTYAGRLNPR
ncbi:MAG: hypothetical protein M5U26_11905 [Planctomycetota bacterium]|nr:hypothetical protein [Planctomycetota bacterium]